ncbi:unnamed protein product [Prorocentrum cordatum]|uniref:Subtilisin n=1 Tax=Prorocentrum cordatum TaxID=2364126 RepID=A0ABN9XM65_9DINO|nr:unnamed protein product [Polarella glacialis]
MMCFRGCCPSGETCHASITSCPSSGTLAGVTSDYAASVPTINGLSVASGLPTNSAACEYSDISCGSCSECEWTKTTCLGASTGTCTGSASTPSPPSPTLAPTPSPPTPAPPPTPPTPAPPPTSAPTTQPADASGTLAGASLGLGVLALAAAAASP